MEKILWAGVLGVFIIGLAGCAYIEPYIQEFNIVSVEQEKELGAKMSEAIAKEMHLVEDSRTRKVRSIGDRLVAVLPRREFDYHFYVVEDKTPNAFTIPGASIYVHTGLLDFVDNDGQIAGVLAHEIGHAFERHSAKLLSRAYGIEYFSQLIFKNQQANVRGLALELAKGGLLTKYSREDEREADELGFFILRRAGMRTDGLLAFLRKLQNLQRGGSPLPFLSSHPPTPERIARLEQLERGAVESAYVSHW